MRKGLTRKTRQWEVVRSIVLESSSGLTIREIIAKAYLMGEELNVTTVYRNVEKLAKSGEILITMGVDGVSRYQCKDKMHTHRLVCIFCMESVELAECPITGLAERISSVTGYKITNHSLELSGVCPKCSGNLE